MLSGSAAPNRIACVWAIFNASRGGTVVLFLLGAAASFWLTGLWHTQFGKPLALVGDHLFLLVQIKNFLNGGGTRFNESLGFPGVQDNLLFPQFDASYNAILYVLSAFTKKLFRIENLFYGVSIVAMYGSAFVSLRMLAVRPWLASVAAVIYVVSPFLAVRAGGHDFLALYFGVPLGATLPYLLARAETWRNARSIFLSWFAIVAVLISGISGLYYAFFTAMFVMVTAFGLAIGRRQPWQLLVGVALCATLLALVIASGYGRYVIELAAGRIPQPPQRYAIEQLHYGLLISESVHVFRDLIPLAQGFDSYFQGLKQVSGANYLFEWPGPLLTIIILAAPALLFAALFDPAAGRFGRLGVIWLSLALISFGLIFATRGGLGFIFNYFVIPAIRAPARIIPFLSFFALVALCTGLEIMLQRPVTLLRGAVVTGVMALLIYGLWTPMGVDGRTTPMDVFWRLQQSTLDNTELQADQQSVSALLQAKDQAALKTILQLPHLFWPEVGPQRSFQDYQHQMPYLLDAVGSRTRWSYGLSSRQPEFQTVSKVVGSGDAGMPARARAGGFDGVLIEKAAYTPEEIANLVEAIESDLSPGCKLFEDERRMLFALGRPADPAVCMEGNSRHARAAEVNLSFKEGGDGQPYLIEGWSTPAPGGTWNLGHTSRLRLPLPGERTSAQAVRMTLRIGIYRPDPASRKTITIVVDGRTLDTIVFEPARPAAAELQVMLPADLVRGKTHVSVTFEVAHPESPLAYGGSDTRVLGFWLESVLLETVP